MEFKDKLKKLRQSRGISQQALADAIFVSRSAVAKWENGLGFPSEESYQALLTYFEVTEDQFRTEKPETVIVSRNRNIRFLTGALIAVVLVVVLSSGWVLGHWFTTARQYDMDALAQHAAAYLDKDELTVLLTEQRADWLAALLSDADGNLCLCVYERDALFGDRWHATGGKKQMDSGGLKAWNYRDSRAAVLIVCGDDLPDEIRYYEFWSNDMRHICPVEGKTLLDIHIIPDVEHNAQAVKALDENQQPLD